MFSGYRILGWLLISSQHSEFHYLFTFIVALTISAISLIAAALKFSDFSLCFYDLESVFGVLQFYYDGLECKFPFISSRDSLGFLNLSVLPFPIFLSYCAKPELFLLMSSSSRIPSSLCLSAIKSVH